MTAAPLDFTFPLVTPPIARDGEPPLRLSLNDLHRVPLDELVAELRRSSNERHRLYPKWIEGGRLSRDAALRHIQILDQILDDITDPAADLADQDRLRFLEEKAARRAAAGIAWADKVRELRREIAMRRNAWPRRIADGRLDLTEARERMERIEAVHWRYWIRCDHFDPAPTLDAIRAHAAAIDAFHAAALHAGDHRLTAHLSAPEIAWLREHYPAAEAAE